MGVFQRLDQFQVFFSVVVHRGDKLCPCLGDGLDLRRDDVAKIFQPHIALALHAETADAVPRDLRKKRAGNTLNTEGEAGVFNGAGVAYIVETLQKCLGLFGRQTVQQRFNVRVRVAELRRRGDGFFRVVRMGNELD